MDKHPVPQGEILLYDNGGEKKFVSVVFQDETFWLTQKAMEKRDALDSPAMGLTTWKGAPNGKNLKSDALAAENYLNEKELSRLNRLVTMFIDYAEVMAEDQVPRSMEDWLRERDQLLTNDRRKVLEGKGHISREAAEKKVGEIYSDFRERQDADCVSDFDRAMERCLKGGDKP